MDFHAEFVFKDKERLQNSQNYEQEIFGQHFHLNGESFYEHIHIHIITDTQTGRLDERDN